ncbi:MAG: hypothetical protein KF764_10525 [Labilithrix sp.]|nr:hypothetical protein [Labilithrix sp.]
MIGTIRNLYAAGLVIGTEGGAFVVVEKRPRKTGRIERVRRPYGAELEETWEDVLAIVAAQRLSGRMTDMLDCAAENVRHAPLKGDCVAFVETSLLGDALPRLLIERDAAIAPIALTGDEEACDGKTGAWTVGPAILQARVTMLFETQRLVVVDELGEGAAILRALERLTNLPTSGPTRDLALAAAIAVWAAERYPSDGPWASARPPPDDSPEAQVLQERELLRQQNLKSRARQRRVSSWRALVEGTLEDDDG